MAVCPHILLNWTCDPSNLHDGIINNGKFNSNCPFTICGVSCGRSKLHSLSRIILWLLGLSLRRFIWCIERYKEVQQHVKFTAQCSGRRLSKIVVILWCLLWLLLQLLLDNSSPSATRHRYALHAHQMLEKGSSFRCWYSANRSTLKLHFQEEVEENRKELTEIRKIP